MTLACTVNLMGAIAIGPQSTPVLPCTRHDVCPQLHPRRLGPQRQPSRAGELAASCWRIDPSPFAAEHSSVPRGQSGPPGNLALTLSHLPADNILVLLQARAPRAMRAQRLIVRSLVSSAVTQTHHAVGFGLGRANPQCLLAAGQGPGAG